MKQLDDHCLIISSPEEIRFIATTDTDHAGCEDTKRSSGGHLVTLGGANVDWGSQKQGSVCLASSDSETVEYSKTCQAIRFGKQLLGEKKVMI